MSEDLSIPNPGYRGDRVGRYGIGQGRVRGGMDPDTRRLAMFAGGVGVILAVLIGASTLMGRRSTEVPVIAADTRPLRVKPDNPGGMKIDGAENDVFSGGSDTADSKLAPPSEAPDENSLRTAEAPPPVQTPTPTAVNTPPPPMPPVVASAPISAPAATAAPAGKPPVVASDPAAAPAGKPPVVASAPTAASAGKPPVVASAPTAASAPKPPVVAGAPTAKPGPVGSVKSQVPAVETHPSAPGHEAMVQLAALTSEEAAHNEWQQLTKRMPDLLNGRQPVFSRTERDGHTFWRVRTSGFADTSQARTFCDRVRAKGGGCSLADF